MSKKRSDAGIKRGPRYKPETDEERLAKPYEERVRRAAAEAMIMASAMYRANEFMHRMTYAETDAQLIEGQAAHYQVKPEDVAKAAAAWKELEEARFQQLQAGPLH